MDIGIPKETFWGENRTPLSPLAVKTLVADGHAVYIETGAGAVSFYDDDHYREAGAQIVYNAEEAFGRAGLIVKIEGPNSEELEMLEDGQILMSFLQPATAGKEFFVKLMDKNITAIGLELIRNNNGEFPIMRALSEIAGQMTISIAARCLEKGGGGRGILLGGAPGVPPAEIVIIGAGNLGRAAARAASANGASVTLMDTDVDQLRRAMRSINSTIVTAVSTPGHIERALKYADAIIIGIHTPGVGLLKHLISREQVKSMKKGSLLIDASIDHGGAVETSRPTTLDDPTYVEEGVVHYCVPNISSAVPRTASRVLADNVTPYIIDIANHGVEKALRLHKSLFRGVFTYNGTCCNPTAGELFGLDCKPLEELLEQGGN